MHVYTHTRASTDGATGRKRSRDGPGSAAGRYGVCVWMDVGAGRLRIVVGLDRKKHVAVKSV